MATPFSTSGSLAYPPETGMQPVQLPFGGAGSFESKVEAEYNIPSAGTIDVDFGTLAAPGAKGFLLEVDANSTGLPINVRFNGAGAAGQMEVSPGGHVSYFSPLPATGITAISIVSTSPNRVRVRVLG